MSPSSFVPQRLPLAEPSRTPLAPEARLARLRETQPVIAVAAVAQEEALLLGRRFPSSLMAVAEVLEEPERLTLEVEAAAAEPERLERWARQPVARAVVREPAR